jgi:hypothetical protein
LKTSGFENKRILITVKAYPAPSISYGETVCCAGLDIDRLNLRSDHRRISKKEKGPTLSLAYSINKKKKLKKFPFISIIDSAVSRRVIVPGIISPLSIGR